MPRQIQSARNDKKSIHYSQEATFRKLDLCNSVAVSFYAIAPRGKRNCLQEANSPRIWKLLICLLIWGVEVPIQEQEPKIGLGGMTSNSGDFFE